MIDFREYYEILDEENKKKIKDSIVNKLLEQIEITDFSKYVNTEIEELMDCVTEDIDLSDVMDSVSEKLKEKIMKVM